MAWTMTPAPIGVVLEGGVGEVGVFCCGGAAPMAEQAAHSGQVETV